MTRRARGYRISEVSRLTGLTADTLRYYERAGVLPEVKRSASGIRHYDERDLSRLRFIRRAQSMNFSLAEIAALLEMRERPQHAREEVRRLTQRKLEEVQARLAQLETLRNELQLLLNLCRASAQGCPIIEGLSEDLERR